VGLAHGDSLNMTEHLRAQGHRHRRGQAAAELGVPVVETVRGSRHPARRRLINVLDKLTAPAQPRQAPRVANADGGGHCPRSDEVRRILGSWAATRFGWDTPTTGSTPWAASVAGR